MGTNDNRSFDEKVKEQLDSLKQFELNTLLLAAVDSLIDDCNNAGAPISVKSRTILTKIFYEHNNR